MASQPVPPPPPSSSAKPVAAHPVFPLSQVELQRWYRFAQKGGVGRARAKVDKVSQDAARDLMFLEGDEVVVLMDLGSSSYLGFCEGVTGLFNGADVVMQQARLKRPVVSTRSSSSTSRPAAPPEQALPRRGSSTSLATAAESGSSTAPRRPAHEPQVEVLADRSMAVEILANAYSPELAGAFTSPSFPSPSTSSIRRARPYADSPAPSSTSTGTTRTPSLVTSPYSDFVDRERDDESVSSMSGHGLTPAQGPFTPVEHGGAWQSPPPRESGKAEQLRRQQAQDPRDGPTPTTESFPLDAFPLPAFGELSLSDAAPTPYSSPDAQRRLEHSSQSLTQPSPSARRPSHAVAASGVPVPLPSPRQLSSAFSFSPSSSTTSALPPSLLSSTDLYADREPREPKSSGSTIASTSTSGQHVPGTPTDDPTLAFIFDAYRYSMAQPPVEAGQGANSPARSLRDLGGPDALEELADVDSRSGAAADGVSALRTYGAASHLRRGLSSAAPPSSSSARPQHRPAASTSTLASLDSVRIPRLSEAFPRSGTLDSLASWATETSGGARGPSAGAAARRTGSAEARYAMWSPPTPSKDVHLRRPSEQDRRAAAQDEPRAGPIGAGEEEDGPERAPVSRERQRSVPLSDAAHLEQDLAASRRLFHQHFSPPQELVAAAAQQAKLYDHGRRFGSIDELPSPPRRQESPARLRRKSAKGLQISGPAVPGLQAVPRWRSAEDASPVEQSLPAAPGDVFAPSAPSSSPMPQVEVFGASPSAGSRTWASPRLRELSQDSQAVSPSIGSATSPTVSSPQTFTSATSSPVAPSFEDPQDRAEARRRPSGGSASLSKKLRKPLHRAKSSPSLGRQQDDTSSASFSSGGTRPVPARQGSDPFFAAAAAKGKQAASFSSSSKESSERRRVDYSAGISSKDFEEETVQIGKSKFEIVKPLAALLSQPSEGDDSSAASPALGPPPAVDHVTPRRPTAPPPPPHTPSNNLGLSTPSLSHFSPPTPASVEDGGRNALDDYRKKEAQWVAALGSMSPAQVRKSKKMRSLVQAGVPSSVRGKVWAFLAEAEGEKRQGVYQSLCEPGSPSVPQFVEEDLWATLDHPQFAHGSAGRSDILQVLQAFTRFTPLGYYAGLGSVVGLLLTQMPAEDAFWTLVALVRDHGLRQYFPSAQDELRLEALAFEFLLEAMEPKLARRLRELSVRPSDYLAVWHSTLYLTILPQPTVLRIVDLLLFDVKARHRVALALLDLSHLDDRTAFPSRDAALNHLLAPPPTAFTPTLLVPAVAATKVSDDKLKKALVKAAKALEA
ncbi:hypothetical protein JCM9279_006477 [Rhodotorula babjevae]